ncbi:hypothetical protein [Streptomyces sp. A0958]|uniref:hypothetical protein n=1 Tax=Streptomyces sp. A0958 TaxID=2563101 RepID=UPI0019CFF0F7|nr:hypothetical protein [Streptomyces sp. A0958]
MPAAPPGPSPLGLFFGRVVRGDWAGSLKAALWPTGLIVALAVALAMPRYGQGDEDYVGWSDRLRIALAMLLQAVGGGFEVRDATPGGMNSGGYRGGSAYGGSYGDFGSGGQGHVTLSLIPLTVTVLWIGALILGARAVRRQGDGLEAAVRISVVAAAAVLVLGLYAQPEVDGVEVHSSPVLAALIALLIALVTTGAVLQRDVAAQWLARRPAAQSLVRAAGTAVRALAAVLLLCALVGFISYANVDDVSGRDLLVALPLLPNIALLVLSVSWGGTVDYDLSGQADVFGSGGEHGALGLGDLGDELGGWAVTGALATGLVCALVVGLLAARRSADRREQVTAGGLFLFGYLALTEMCGLSAEVSGGVSELAGRGNMEVAPSVADALLFGLLWVGCAVLVAPYLLRLTGRGGGPGGGPGGGLGGGPTQGATPMYPPGQSPYGPPPGTPPAPGPYNPPPGSTPPPGATPPPGPYDPSAGMTAAPEAYAPPTGTPPGPYIPAQATAPAPEPRRRRPALVWGATLVAALVLGGGATAGVIALVDRHNDDPGTSDTKNTKNTKNTEDTENTENTTSTEDSGAEPAQERVGDHAVPTVPDGYRLVSDTAGFAFAVPDLWERQGEENHRVTYSRSAGHAELEVGVVRDAPYTSYENFKALEKTADADRKGYQQIQLTANTFQGRQGARWEYTYEKGGVTIHAIDQSYIAEDGTEYAIHVTERDVEWVDAREVFDTILSTWMLNDVD